LLLGWVGGRQLNWSRLSEVGQAYGAASAILSGLALSGIAISLIVQWRLNRMSQIVSVRDRQFELVKMTLDDPRYAVSWGRDPDDPDLKLKMFSNLIMSWWHMMWEIDALSERQLRSNLVGYFGTSLNRVYWEGSSATWLEPGRRTRRFLGIVDDEWDKATARVRAVEAASSS